MTFLLPSEADRWAMSQRFFLMLRDAIPAELLLQPMPHHDWIHLHFDLWTGDEGIVLAIADCFDYDELPDLELFFDLAMHHRMPEDTFDVARVERAYQQLLSFKENPCR